MKGPFIWDYESYDQGKWDGLNEGLIYGMATVVELQLTLQYGKLSRIKAARLYTLSVKQLETLAKAMLNFKNKADFNHWFRENDLTSQKKTRQGLADGSKQSRT